MSELTADEIEFGDGWFEDLIWDVVTTSLGKQNSALVESAIRNEKESVRKNFIDMIRAAVAVERGRGDRLLEALQELVRTHGSAHQSNDLLRRRMAAMPEDEEYVTARASLQALLDGRLKVLGLDEFPSDRAALRKEPDDG